MAALSRAVGAAGLVGVVDEEAVALFDLVLGVVPVESLDAFRIGAEVDGNAGELSDDAPLSVDEAAGKVVGLADEGGVAGAEGVDLHFPDEAVQPGANDLEDDGINRHKASCPQGVPTAPFRLARRVHNATWEIHFGPGSGVDQVAGEAAPLVE